MRWQKKRWSSNSTFRSTDNSGILQCFRGTTVWAASGGLDMQVPEPLLLTDQMAQKFLKRPQWRPHTQLRSSSSEPDLPCARSHPSDRGTGCVVAIADRARVTAKWRSAVRGTICSSPSTSHCGRTHSTLSVVLVICPLVVVVVPVGTKAEDERINVEYLI